MCQPDAWRVPARRYPMTFSRRALLSLPRARPPEPKGDGGFWLHLARNAMACRFEITLPSELGHHLDAAKDALDTIDALEAQLTIFRETSELAQVNREAADHPVVVEERLFQLLTECQRLWEITDGAFDITSTPLSRTWGFLRRQGRLPTDDEITEARACVGMQHVRLDPTRQTVSFDRPGVSLNLGSIGKGYALDRVAEQMTGAGVPTALLTSGSSSLFALGAGHEGQGYEVGIRDPFDHTRRYGSVRLTGEGLGVSGVGEQWFEHAGRRYGHIIDPRSGWPVEGRALVAVVAPTAALADALATAFFVGGPETVKRYHRAYPDVSVVVIDMPLQGKYTPPVPIFLGRRADWRLPVVT
jgi:FAD:protein FMN transferase